MRKKIETSNAPAAIGPYSQAITCETFIFCSGQIPLDPQSGELISPDDVVAQVHQIMKNIRAVLSAAGSGLDHIVKTTIFLMDMADFGSVNQVYGSYFEGKIPPARSTIQVSGLPKGARVEIEVIAVRA